MKLKTLCVATGILLSASIYAGPTKKIELLGLFINSSTTLNPSAEIKVVTVNCAMVSTSVCAPLTVPDYVVPGTTPQYFPLGNDQVQAGQVFHIETPTTTETGTFTNVTKTVNPSTGQQTFEIEAEEIDYTDFLNSATKKIDVLGLYQTMSTSPAIIGTGDGPVSGNQTRIVCAMVSTSVCVTIETSDLGIPQTMNPQTHNGPLPKGFYKSITANGVVISGLFYTHFQGFTDATMLSREHVFQYQTLPVVGQ